MKLDVRKCLDIVCEIQRAIFVRQLGQLAMFLNGDKMMKLSFFVCGCIYLKKS